jgi:MoaA/NifB/PqqE/SkfB family radical SAM enzyme
VHREFTSVFDKRIRTIFRKAVTVTLSDLRLAPFFARALFEQFMASRKRDYQAACGLQVPALAIVSVTRRCNLRCAGCYSRSLHGDKPAEMTPALFRKVLDGFSRLGTGIVLIAGGEPLLHPAVLKVAAEYPRITFPVFTNGLLLDKRFLAFFRSHRQFIPLISIEGDATQTDDRRGKGVSARFEEMAPLMRGMFWGVSFTLTRENYTTVTDRAFITRLLRKGCRLFIFVEYVPVDENSRHLVLTPEQKNTITPLTDTWTRDLPGLFVVFPGDEDQYGGCLSSGRGFLHVAPDGAVEPCPFAPHSDRNLNDCTLEEALNSPLLKRLQAHPEDMAEGEGGCALWARRKEVFDD